MWLFLRAPIILCACFKSLPRAKKKNWIFIKAFSEFTIIIYQYAAKSRVRIYISRRTVTRGWTSYNESGKFMRLRVSSGPTHFCQLLPTRKKYVYIHIRLGRSVARLFKYEMQKWNYLSKSDFSALNLQRKLSREASVESNNLEKAILGKKCEEASGRVGRQRDKCARKKGVGSGKGERRARQKAQKSARKRSCTLKRRNSCFSRFASSENDCCHFLPPYDYTSAAREEKDFSLTLL